jgi:hypothetical protein
MEPLWSDAVKRLRGSERVPLAANGRDVLRALQDRYRIQLPDDFAAYVASASPREDWMDDFGMIWWGAERIKSLRDECGDESPGGQPNAKIGDEADQYLVFADFLIWCYAYAICCSDGPNRGRIALIGAQPDRFVAGSFSSFLTLAAQDSPLIHSPAGDASRTQC